MKITLTVKGLRYRVTAATMRTMSDVTPLNARLEREPDNLYDKNAVKVIICDKPWDDFHVGYLDKVVAKEIAPKLDKGTLEITKARVLSIDPEEAQGEIRIEGRKRKSLQKR